MEYAEHNKLNEVKNDAQTIGEFLDYLCREELVICIVRNAGESEFERYEPLGESAEEIIARYFSIDLDKLEEEKLQMLDELRKANEKD